ncbi:endo alpha-1,4 polygalactosaminidase [Nocardioides acrostichi]|uniref:Endo alpha-1,4 polygalactosaminidase n=1 Tax=Nocardioides acrostichi TaxID=2784339 RepID=A0A930V0S0_9ACTN|nr:endo alpha-1,4 polygalactosaminidase [Nocardioides acrostichi]MBF4161924.1 endo alpha-1,4 polygalactosaminidase [Nocardioides acrostichi]
MRRRAMQIAIGMTAVVALAWSGSASALEALPSDTNVDYQLGGAAGPDDGVGIVVRDRSEAPADGLVNVCYVNGFQTQPDQKRFWRHRWSLVLKRDGKPVVDSAWGEWLLDLRTEKKRQRLAAIMGGWTQGCADDGYDAVEYDNLDSYSRSHGLLTPRQAKRYAHLLVDGAHDAGLLAGQKNRAGWDGTVVGYDFAVAEECGRYDECTDYTDHYGDQVLAVEYRRPDFTRTCDAIGADVPVVLRDRDLTPDGVHAYC